MDGTQAPAHDREEFQLERLILFTDAVFAIAITLLAIEIKVPELHHASETDALRSLAALTPRFIGFFISFFIIAIYWAAHHRIFRFVRRTSPRLLWLNIVFLLSIVLMPFSTAFQSEYGLLRTPWIVYALNIICCGLLQARMQVYLRTPAAGLVHPQELRHPELDPARPLLSPLVFFISIGLALLPFWPAPLLRPVPMLLLPLYGLYRRRYQRLEREYQAAGGLATG